MLTGFPARRKALDYRLNPAQLLLSGHRRGAGSRRLTPHVQHFGSVLCQLFAVCDSAFGIKELPAVRERVRGHVDDPHDLRRLQVAPYCARISCPLGVSSTK